MEFSQYSVSDTVGLIQEQQINEEIELSEDVDSAAAIFSRKKRTYSIEQLNVQENFNELMKTCEYSKLDGNDQSGFTPFHHAAKENNIDLIKLLVANGCDVNVVDADEKQQTPLHKAAMFGHVESIKLLLENNADANQCDNDGNTPLQTAVIYGGDIQVVKTLIEKTDLLKENKNGQNSLHIAVTYHQVDVINLILNHEQGPALISKADEDGFTPLHVAVSLGHLDTVENFLNKLGTIDITKTITIGKNVLHLAATTHNVALMALLLKFKDASELINQPDSQLRTPLHDAAKYGQLGQVTLLLDKGAMACITSNGYSPLHYACDEGHLDVAKKLLERHPFQVHFLARNKNTALHLAALKGHAAIVKFLLDFEETPITHNILSVSFLDLAILHKHSAVASEAVKHNRWEECLDLVSPACSPPIIQLIENLPDVALSVMDHSITSTLLLNHTGYLKNYNFKYLSVNEKMSSKKRVTVIRGCFWLILHYMWSIFTLTDDKSLDVIKAILRSNHADKFLTHPLLVTFINLKWRNYGRLYIQIRASVPTMLTILLTVLFLISDPPRLRSATADANSTAYGEDDLHESVPDYLTSITLTVNFMYVVVLLIQAILFIRLRKVFHWVHYSAELASIVFTAVFILTYPTQWLAGVAALLCSWIGLNLFSSYFDVFGLYTIMFYDLLLRIVKAILVGLYYIIGFGLVMYVLIGDDPLYNSPWIAVYTTFFSVINGFDIGLLAEKDQDDTLQYKNATFVIALLLTVVLTVTLLSLLIGIAVRSIVNIQKDAIAHQARLKASLFLEIDPNIPHILKRRIIPMFYKVEESNPMTTAIRNIWNYVAAFFATQIEGHNELHKNAQTTKASFAMLNDVTYHVKEMETRIKSIQRQQDAVLMELKKLNLQTESTTTTVI